MRILTYLRVSTDRQADKDLSLPAQRQAIAAWAAQHGATIVREFVDAGESARTADRPAFLDMIACAKATPGLDAVVVYALDRFSRSRLDHALYKSLLKKLGVRVLAVTQPLDETPESIILEGVLETFSEYYSANLSRIISRGMRQAAEAKGSRPGGTIPYGFRSQRVDGRVTLVPHAREAAAVRRMATFVLRGLSLPRVARQLEAEGIRYRSGRRFSVSQLHRLLHNRALVGDLVWNRRARGTGRYTKSPDVWVTVPDAWEPILDRATFARVAGALGERAPTDDHPKQPSPDHLLTGILVCGTCHARYTVERAQVRGKAYHYYDCGTRRKEGVTACPGARLRVDETDRQVIRGLLAWLMDDRRVARILTLYLKRGAADTVGLERQAAALNRWDTELAARRERLLDALESGKVAPAVLTERLGRVDRERDELSEKRQALERAQSRIRPIPTADMFHSLGRDLERRLASGPPAAAKALLKVLVRQIVVRRQRDNHKPTLQAEIIAASPRNLSTSDDDFAPRRDWWTNRDGRAKSGSRTAVRAPGVWLKIA